MITLLAILAPASLAAALMQPPPLPGSPCLPPEAHVDEATARSFCAALSAAGKGRVRPGRHRVHLVAAFAAGDASFREVVELFQTMAGIDDLEE